MTCGTGHVKKVGIGLDGQNGKLPTEATSCGVFAADVACRKRTSFIH